MTAVRRPALAVGLLVALACATAVAAGGGGTRPSTARCVTRGESELASGRELAAVVRNELVVSDRALHRPQCSTERAVRAGAVLRHVTQRPGVGTAYVRDFRGPDELAVVTEGGAVTAGGAGEITHPAWSPGGRLAYAVDLEHLELWRPGSSQHATVAPPQLAEAVFSPVWPSRGSLLAIVQEPVAGIPGEDTGLDNLWRYEFEARSWSRATDFQVSGDKWSALRTPVVDGSGAVLFIRVQGRSSAAQPPSFELWKARGGAVSKLEDLPGEMYLAGWDRGGLVFNVPSARCDGWELLRQSSSGLKSMGCGVTLADPTDAIDPDLMDAASTPTEPIAGERALAVVVGDFARRSQAEALERSLKDASGQRVVGHRAAPEIVAPGAWAVLRPIAESTSPRAALKEVGAALPPRAGAWLTPLPTSD